MATAWKVPGLARNPTFADAAGRVLITRWREMMSYREGTLAGDDIEQLHAMRVSSRRLRAAMDAFAGAFPPESFARNLRTVKRITDTLGAVRDLDVAIAGLNAMVADLPAEERAGIEGLAAEYRARRDVDRRAVHRLFRELDRDDFGRRFERWVGRHTGVAPKRLATQPPNNRD